MSLFHNPREIRVVTAKKRKKPLEDALEKYACDLCIDEYDSETDLDCHRKYKHRVEMNKMLLDDKVCKTCIKKYESYEHLIKHIKTHHLLSSEDSEYVEREIYVCDICHLIYFNKQMLSIHIQYSHDRANKYKTATECPKCSKIIQIKNVWFHFKRHLTQSIASCPICLKKCNNQIDLNSHLRTHPCYYRCNICQYDASNKNYFETHMKAHNTEGNDINENTLKICFAPQKSPRRSDVSAGLRGLRLFELQICVLCRAICTKQTKSDHISLCHVVHRLPEKKKEYNCSCGEVYFNSILLRHHIFKMKSDEHKPCGEVSLTQSVSEPAEPSVSVSLLVENGSLPCFVMGPKNHVEW